VRWADDPSGQYHPVSDAPPIGRQPRPVPPRGLRGARLSDLDRADGRGGPADRLGLGCENWPKCGGTPLPPLSTHALIEFGNRAVSFIVGVIIVAVVVLAWTRRPFRRELFGALLRLQHRLPLFVAPAA
jgi:cytochrome c oxidase assembly protein subunit 15